jgi:hypothetical protein
LSSWHKKISEEIELDFEDEDIEVGETFEVSTNEFLSFLSSSEFYI